MMTPKAAANHTPSLGSDAPDDKMRAPYLGVHMRRPFCLFGHVTPHGPIQAMPWMCTRHNFTLTSPVNLQKLNVASAPYTTCSHACIKDVIINGDGSCGNGWVCEHRWPPIAGMAGFAKASNGMGNDHWWNEGNSAAWGRGGRAFIAITKQTPLERTFYTGEI